MKQTFPMKKPTVGLALVLMVSAIAVSPAIAQDRGSVVTLIPTADWQLRSSQSGSTSMLTNWGGDPAIEHEYGVTSYTARSYTFANHKADVLIEQAADPSSAYGLLTFYRTPATTPLDGKLTVAAPGKALLARGPAFIRVSVSAADTLPLGDFVALLRLVGGPPPGPRALSQLPEPLPSRGLVDGSQKYALGPLAAAKILPALTPNLIGFDEGAELQTGLYRIGNSSATLTLAAIDYPTPQIARAEFDKLNNTVCQARPGSTSPQTFDCRRRDTYVLVAINAPSRTLADQFLDGFTVSKTISQEQPNPGDHTVLDMLRLLIANGVLIMMLGVFSLAGGILVFVSKRLARKWFANSLFVEAEGAGIIILDLSDANR
jgi:hypothetical protein